MTEIDGGSLHQEFARTSPVVFDFINIFSTDIISYELSLFL